ncbi:MAG: PIG-L family deacetylase [Prevotella sp.]|nr:PIG-L family deacetylase [Prevotella sp.]
MNLNLTSTITTDRYPLRRDIVKLCQTVGKPLLKLSTRDYAENGMMHWVEHFGSAALVNIEVFNELQHTITGWPGGKPNADDTTRPERALPFPKRVIVFSPHPDDDVISMGGTIRRLIQQGNEVHIAYETSGDIAVDNEEVRRYLHFVRGFKNLFASDDEVIISRCQDVLDAIRERQDDEAEATEVLAVKSLIRQGEARLACAYNGIPSEHIHFLELPFYESGKIEKLPMTERDVEPIRRLLTDIKPHQVYVAADLADPHGTHRKCTDAVLAAIDEEQKAGAVWIDDCRVWMYRGAWAEWDVADIEMCVPMSPEELREKRNAILKHQSQMESAPFLGNDERLFWQRAEDRNRETAMAYDRLGLACYEAMEAFVEYRFKP